MKDEHVSLSVAAIAAGALLYSTASFSELAALLAPMLAHELGHVAALRLFGLRIRSFRLELRGLCIEYAGVCSAAGEMLAALAGPLLGFVYAWGAAQLGARWGSEMLTLSAGVSLILSLLNLLPILPLDGGRVLLQLTALFLGSRRADRLCNALGLALSALLLAAGSYLMWTGRGMALAVFAIYLLLAQGDETALVKPKELL